MESLLIRGCVEIFGDRVTIHCNFFGSLVEIHWKFVEGVIEIHGRVIEGAIEIYLKWSLYEELNYSFFFYDL